MGLRVVGAGLGRTGTASLKGALELLLGDRCYHMLEVSERDDPVWHAAVRGEPVDLDALLGGYSACVDWPACAFWRELSEANPGALILLSTRDSPQEWWASMERTIVAVVKRPVPAGREALLRHRAMVRELLGQRFTRDWDNPTVAMAAYERHNDDVRRSVAAERLIDWHPGDGWEPICSALGLPRRTAPSRTRTRRPSSADRQSLTRP